MTLEVPLSKLLLGGFFQGDDPRGAGVEVLHEAFDGSALAGGVAAFKKEEDFLPGLAGGVLGFEQLDLELAFLFVVHLARHFFPVGVRRAQDVFLAGEADLLFERCGDEVVGDGELGQTVRRLGFGGGGGAGVQRGSPGKNGRTGGQGPGGMLLFIGFLGGVVPGWRAAFAF